MREQKLLHKGIKSVTQTKGREHICEQGQKQEGKYRKHIQTANESKLNSEQLNSEKGPNLVANLGKSVMNMAENLKFGSLLSLHFSLHICVKTPGDCSAEF